MSKRQQRLREKKRWQESLRLAKKHRLEEAFRVLGLLPGFRSLPTKAREALLLNMYAKPIVSIDASAQGVPEAVSLRKEILALLDTPIDIGNGTQVPASEFMSTYAFLTSRFDLVASSHAPGHCVFFKKLSEVANAAHDSAGPHVYDRLAGDVRICLLRYSQVDQHLFGLALDDSAIAPGTPNMQFLLCRIQPAIIQVDIDGKCRRALQCGIPSSSSVVNWIECDGTAFGKPEGAKLPLYCQRHAIDRLRERIPSPLFSEHDREVCFWNSVCRPVVTKQDNNDFLIEYRVGKLRLGYLVAHVAADKIVISTFLFLTNQGTPESQLLWKNLRLSRRDIEYQRLDCIDTYLNPALQGDAELSGILARSGCKPLLELGTLPPSDRSKIAAEELKRFFGLTGQNAAKCFAA